ncbi:MAG: hypothetical protein JW943_08240 [Deltaproteobacteria bacterium]|nr:hypothetical protein [Deltaproteobacteria bacterium]
MLALAKRMNQDPRTLGTLFYAWCEELQQATFAEAIILVLIFLAQVLAALSSLTKNFRHSLIGAFLKALPPTAGARWLIAWQNNAAYY